MQSIAEQRAICCLRSQGGGQETRHQKTVHITTRRRGSKEAKRRDVKEAKQRNQQISWKQSSTAMMRSEALRLRDQRSDRTEGKVGSKGKESAKGWPAFASSTGGPKFTVKQSPWFPMSPLLYAWLCVSLSPRDVWQAARAYEKLVRWLIVGWLAGVIIIGLAMETWLTVGWLQPTQRRPSTVRHLLTSPRQHTHPPTYPPTPERQGDD